MGDNTRRTLVDAHLALGDVAAAIQVAVGVSGSEGKVQALLPSNAALAAVLEQTGIAQEDLA